MWPSRARRCSGRGTGARCCEARSPPVASRRAAVGSSRGSPLASLRDVDVHRRVPEPLHLLRHRLAEAQARSGRGRGRARGAGAAREPLSRGDVRGRRAAALAAPARRASRSPGKRAHGGVHGRAARRRRARGRGAGRRRGRSPRLFDRLRKAEGERPDPRSQRCHVRPGRDGGRGRAPPAAGRPLRQHGRVTAQRAFPRHGLGPNVALRSEQLVAHARRRLLRGKPQARDAGRGAARGALLPDRSTPGATARRGPRGAGRLAGALPSARDARAAGALGPTLTGARRRRNRRAEALLAGRVQPDVRRALRLPARRHGHRHRRGRGDPSLQPGADHQPALRRRERARPNPSRRSWTATSCAASPRACLTRPAPAAGLLRTSRARRWFSSPRVARPARASA